MGIKIEHLKIEWNLTEMDSSKFQTNWLWMKNNNNNNNWLHNCPGNLSVNVFRSYCFIGEENRECEPNNMKSSREKQFEKAWNWMKNSNTSSDTFLINFDCDQSSHYADLLKKKKKNSFPMKLCYSTESVEIEFRSPLDWPTKIWINLKPN